ncbi:hypothetical protein CSB20_01865 [bacterium DOLZORAL124_64_63]|nr:MAG: hypothetical protein CSB20_01865 [bacterium DOLZORAL124_64_63]
MVRTRKFSVVLVLMALASLTLAGSAALAGSPGDAGLLFLRMGVGAREAAMGGAGVASSQGASAVFWNPANNVFADFQTVLVLQHYDYLSIAGHESAAVAHRVGRGVVGFSFTGLYFDEQQRYGDDGVAVPAGTFSPYDVAFGLSYARPLGKSFAVGANAKMVYEKVDLYSDSGLALDLFVTHRARIQGLVFAASATNLGGKMDLNAGSFSLPTAYRLGAAYSPPALLDGRFTATCDMVFPNDTTEKAHVGAEMWLIPELVLRVGSALNYDMKGWTAGLGCRLERVGIDYAYEDNRIAGFDAGHKFSVQFTW